MSVGYGPIIVIIAFLLLIAAMPTWPYSRQWGYRPTMVLAIIFMMVAVFVAIGGFGPARAPIGTAPMLGTETRFKGL